MDSSSQIFVLHLAILPKPYIIPVVILTLLTKCIVGVKPGVTLPVE